jgi:hypothetical protein
MNWAKSPWGVVATGTFAIAALALLMYGGYLLRLKWSTGSLELVPAASAASVTGPGSAARP